MSGPGNFPPGQLPNNPYEFPLPFLSCGKYVNDAPVPNLPPHMKISPVENIHNVLKLSLRDDDVVLAAFPKSGTHWLAEILRMLMNESTSYAKTVKEMTMLEFMSNPALLEKLPSPRLLNTHLYMDLLPKQVLEKKIKIIHAARNPKDVAVSWYHHVKQFAPNPDTFTFDKFLKGYTTPGHVNFGSQPDYLRQMTKFEKTHPNHPVKNVYFEDLKRNPLPIVKDLAEFLGKSVSDEFCRNVIDACGFDKLKKVDEARAAKDIPIKMTIYRKGKVGDWKNSFTVAQNEFFDDFLNEQKKKGLAFQFDVLNDTRL